MTFDFTAQLVPVFWTMVALVALPAALIANAACRGAAPRGSSARPTTIEKGGDQHPSRRKGRVLRAARLGVQGERA